MINSGTKIKNMKNMNSSRLGVNDDSKLNDSKISKSANRSILLKRDNRKDSDLKNDN